MDLTRIRSASLFYFSWGGAIAASQLLVILLKRMTMTRTCGNLSLILGACFMKLNMFSGLRTVNTEVHAMDDMDIDTQCSLVQTV